jgi:ADP-heptose:LPS heptosyltransferase
LENNKKILIIRFSSIGDIILASPVFRCVKKQIPNAQVHFLSEISCKRATDHNPYIDQFFYFDNFIDKTIEQLQLEKYDHIVDLENDANSKKIVKALKVKALSINALSFKKSLFEKLKINFLPTTHIVQRFLDVVSSLNIKDDGGGLDFYIAKEDEVASHDLPTAHSAGYYVLNIGSKYFTKTFPTDKFIELCSKLDHPIIIVGGREDILAGAQIAAQDTIKIYNACGKFNHGETADIMQKAKVVIGNVNDLMYMACAFKKPIVTLWGSTSPKFGKTPYYGENFMRHQQKPMFENVYLNLRCQPCSETGFDICPKGHFNCMQKIDVNEIITKIKTIR